jgi:hypothetical protein
MHTFSSERKALKDFLELYKVQHIILPTNSAIRDLKPKKDRICRFCQSSNENGTFRNEAHLIPHFLGKKYVGSAEKLMFYKL